MTRGDAIVVLAGAVLAAAAGVEGYRVAHPRVPHARAAWFAWPARIVVEDFATPAWRCERIEVAVAPRAALRGRVELERVVVRGLEKRGVFPAGVEEAALAIERGAPQRLAFFGARVGEVRGLAGTAVRASDGAWLARAAAPGVLVEARAGSDGVSGRATLSELAWRGAHLRGTLDFDLAGGAVTLSPRLSAEDVTFTHPALASAPLADVALGVAGTLTFAGGRVRADAVRVSLGHLRLLVDGELRSRRDFDLTVTLPESHCADVLSSLPRALVPHLAGLIVDGTLAARLHVTRDDDVPDLALEGKLACRVQEDAALAAVSALPKAGPLPSEGAPASSWRALDALPKHLAKAILVAEDGRFYQHHGIDLERIGHALAADLDAGGFDRGASTITQQLAKNLWLDGERTLGRKLEELILAWRLEHVLDKHRILELYVNLVELAPGVHGVEDAAARYFGKVADELSPDEAAQLAALLPAPRRGMDSAWERRYHALVARMPRETVPEPQAPKLADATRR